MSITPSFRTSFDGVTEAANITSASTSGGSGSPITDGTTTKAVAKAASAIRGAKGAHLVATGVNCFYSYSLTAAGTASIQVYFHLDTASLPTATQDFLHIRGLVGGASTRLVSCRMTTAGVLQAHDAGSTLRWTTTTKPADGWYVLTLTATKGTTSSNGQMTVWLRNESDDSLVSSTPAGGTAITAINTGVDDYTEVRFMKTSSTGNWTIDWDEPAGYSGSTHDEITRVSAIPAPGADAGEPQAVEAWSTVTLDGTASEGAIDTWTWALTAVTGAAVTGTGPWTVTDSPFVGTVTLASSNSALPTFAAPADLEEREYTFSLGTSASGVPSDGTSTVDITVLPATEFATSGGVLVPLRLQYEA